MRRGELAEREKSLTLRLAEAKVVVSAPASSPVRSEPAVAETKLQQQIDVSVRPDKIHVS